MWDCHGLQQNVNTSVLGLHREVCVVTTLSIHLVAFNFVGNRLLMHGRMLYKPSRADCGTSLVLWFSDFL